MEPDESERRIFLRALAVLPIAWLWRGPIARLDPLMAEALLAEARIGRKKSGTTTTLKPTPDCADDDDPTPSETAGPFFKPSSPQRTSLLEPGMEGERVVLTGQVFTRHCKPVGGALLDFWHADDSGEYDSEGFRLRGHQYADKEGRFKLETIVAGLYPGRTRHYHVRVQPPGGRVLTTQLYFPGEPRNQRDGLFRSDLLMAVRDAANAKQARFHFVLG